MSRKPRPGHDPITLARLRLEARRSLRALALWLTLAAAGVYAALFLFAHLHVTLPWQHDYSFRVAVPDAKGVVAGSDEVRIAGVPVGNVTAVGLRGNQPVLTVHMDDKYAPIYRDARAELRPNTPLEDMYLDITSRGTRGAGRLGPKTILVADRTKAPVDIGEVLDVFTADVRPRMATAIAELGRGLDDHGVQLRETLVGLAPFLRVTRRLSEQIATREDQTRELIHNFELMTGELARRDRQLHSLIRGAGTTFQAIGDASGPLERLLAALPATLREMPTAFTALRKASDALDPALTSMLPVADALPAGLRALTRFSDTARPAARALRAPLAPLTRLLDRTTPVSRNLSESFSTLQPQIPQLDRATAAIVPCERNVAAYFNWWLSVYKYSDDLTAIPRTTNNTGVNAAGAAPDPNLKPGPSCTNTEPRK